MNPVAAGRFRPAPPCSRPVNWAATGRYGGVSAAPFESLNLSTTVGDDQHGVLENQARASQLVGVQPYRVLDARHGAQVDFVSEGGIADGCDGMVTTTPGLALMVLAADCVPIVLADPTHGVIAVAHCGWRGLVAGIVEATVELMYAHGADKIQAITGPAICVNCYPVQQDCVTQLQTGLPDGIFSSIIKMSEDQHFVDVRAGVHAQLGVHGIHASSITRCTHEDPSLFSYRRDGRTGRQAMVIAL
jgi:YfiH family protein